MALTVNNTLFGAPGVSDPVMFHPGLVGIKRKVNFAKTPFAAGTSYALFGLPKAFVATGAFVEETAKCPAVNITLGTKHHSPRKAYLSRLPYSFCPQLEKKSILFFPDERHKY